MKHWIKSIQRPGEYWLAVLALVALLAQPGQAAGQASEQATPVEGGRRLFLANCAHCHAEDGSGDEGPSLHGLRKSDDRIAKLIREGIKGEMPRFGSKLSDAEVQNLIAFVRSLK
jgi:mono/diheme cytochrome c family protein